MLHALIVRKLQLLTIFEPNRETHHPTHDTHATTNTHSKRVVEYGIAKGKWLHPDWHYTYHYSEGGSTGGTGGSGGASGSSGSAGGGASGSGGSAGGGGGGGVVRQHPDNHMWLYFRCGVYSCLK